MAREKKEKPPKKVKAPKKEKAPRKSRRAGQEDGQKDETLLQKLMRQAKIKGEDQEEAEPAEAPEEQQEETGKGKKKLFLLLGAILLVLAAAAVVVIFVLLPRLSGDKDPEESAEPSHEPVLYELPESFQVGGETVAAVVPVNPDGVQSAQDPWVSYTYTGMSDAGAEAEAYAGKLSSAGFSVVDEEFVRTQAPDYTAAEGTVLLAKDVAKTASPAPSASAGEGGEESDSPAPSPSPVPEEEQKDMVVKVQVDWSADTMVVTCDQAEGKVTSPAGGQAGSMTPGAAMSMSEAVDYLYSLSPSDLGLVGESMEDYHIYAKDGAVLVNEQPCMQLNIYSREENDQSNRVAGIYLMTRDGEHMYLLDEEHKSVKEIDVPPPALQQSQPEESEPVETEEPTESEQPTETDEPSQEE